MLLVRAVLTGLVFVLAMAAVPALAEDWVAVKLRGSVFVFVDDHWTPLHRGDAVPDNRVVRTQPSGHVLLQRGTETIDVGPNSQIEIVDRTGRRYTTVKEHYGTVEIEADVRNVQHFEVRTPYLAAIVKGTNFVVTSGKETSRVYVKRGKVAVEDLATHAHVDVTAGQSAATAPGGGLSTEGKPSRVDTGNPGLPPGTTTRNVVGIPDVRVQTNIEDHGVDVQVDVPDVVTVGVGVGTGPDGGSVTIGPLTIDTPVPPTITVEPTSVTVQTPALTTTVDLGLLDRFHGDLFGGD
jgi:hypothetical protein